jgi:P27 family predicted phage terminase small subunit
VQNGIMRQRTGKPPLAIIDAPPVTPPSPPRALRAAGHDLWSRVQGEYVVTDVGGVELLQQCCEAADLVQELSERVARDGVTLETKTGVRAHPALRDMLSARAFLVTTLRRLGVTNEPVARMGRPSGPRWRGANNADQ